MTRHRIILAAILGLTLLSSAAAQRWEETPRVGIAVEDTASAPLVNMASLGVGNATGIGWSGYYNGDNNPDTTFHLTSGWLSYAYRGISGVNNHEIGLGFPVAEGLYLGTSWRWDNSAFVDGGISAQALYRPYNWISLGIKGESLNQQPWMDWGVGLRPLVFSNYWRSRLTLFYDARLDSSGDYQNLATGLRFHPIDGLELTGHWDFRTESLRTGINLSFRRLLLGGEVTSAGEERWAEGNAQFFVSMKSMRSLSPRQEVMVMYDVAQIITDSPRLYAAAQDLRPDPARTRSIYEFLEDMERIRQSPEIVAVFFDSQAFRTSFSNLIEIEQALWELKEAGKKIYFYADTMGSRQYALAASVADAIVLSPQGVVDLTGFGTTNLYLKDLLTQFGINVYNFQSHEYKTVYNQLSESAMTDAERDALETVYGGLQAEMDRMILNGRGDKLTAPLEDLYENGLWMSAQRAKESGLIDEVMYRDQVNTWVGTRRFRTITYSDSRWDMDYEWDSTNRSTIAVIYATGGITMGEGIQGSSIGAETLASAIRRARLNPFIQAIVLRVDSGGGSSLASDIIAREVALSSSGPRSKPVVVSMGGSAASGGYMISAPGTRILATPATITGSIGVITMIPEISGLLNQFSVGVDTVQAEGSTGSPNLFTPLSPEEEQRIRESIMDHYDSFIELVAEHRPLTVEEVDAVAQGRIWTGRQARERGLVDSIGGFSDAIDLAKNLAGDRNARVLEINPGNITPLFPGVPGAIATFLELETPNPVEILPGDLVDLVEFYRSVEMYRRGEALFLMPYTLEELGAREGEED